MLPGSKSSDVADAETIDGGAKPVRPAGPLSSKLRRRGIKNPS